MSTTDLQTLIIVRHMLDTGEARRRRLAAGLSLTEVAAAVPVDTSTLWRWETHRRKPRGQAAMRYARVLDLLKAA